MRNFKILLVLVATVTLIAVIEKPEKSKYGLISGKPDIKSVNALAFGPEGILFVGDSRNAAVYALNTDDTNQADAVEDFSIEDFDVFVAEALGAMATELTIQDVVVNPLSKNIYVAAHRNDGVPAILKVDSGTREVSSVLSGDVDYAKASIDNPVDEEATDRRGRSLRVWTVSDMAYYKGNVMVTGLSNAEFASTFRSIPFPFNDNQKQSSLEIYHAAHGQYETHSPVKTFTPTEIEGEDYIVASYTCTPLVLFPLNEMKAGQHVKGKTVAELGWGNTPLDMVTISQDDQRFLVMSNSNRTVMKIGYDDMSSFQESLSTPTTSNEPTAGVDFIDVPLVSVVQMDKLDDSNVLILQRRSNGDLDLYTRASRRF